MLKIHSVNRLLFLLAALLVALSAAVAQDAKTVRVTLDTGSTIDGVIQNQNDEVILLVTERGERYQLRRSSIVSIGEPVAPVVEEEKPVSPFGMTIQAGAGASWAAGTKTAAVDADIIMGHRLLLGGAMFLGAGVGYSGALGKDSKRHFLPLYLHMKYTFLPDRKSSPLVSASAGYAFSLTKDVKGGAMGDIALMFHHKVGRRGGINLGVYFRAHGYRAEQTVEEDGNNYTGKVSGAIYSVGGRFAVDL